jgi:hypothetical protein
MVCPGSVGMAKQVPKPESSEYAIEGTCAHEVAARCLTTGEEPWTLLSWLEPKTKLTVDVEMAIAVSQFVFAIRKTHEQIEPGNVEHSFHCPEAHPDFFGTADFWAVEGRTLHVWDYKHGAGIAVDVVANPQTMYYACGVLHSRGLLGEVDGRALSVLPPDIRRVPTNLGRR